jgi:hypothetical protein
MTTSSSVPDNGGDHSGGGGSGGGYVDDVFSTYVYEGTQTVTDIKNGIDLAGEDGMVWLKGRTTTKYHRLIRNDGGTLKSLSSNSTDAENSNSYITSFNSDGFTISGGSQTNESGQDYTSWTFRKAKNFFDVVTYTGDKVQGREIPHSLGCVPGMIIIKSTSSSGGNWSVYSRGSNGGVQPEGYNLVLNTIDPQVDSNAFWADTAPTATHFTIGGANALNNPGEEHIAYLFAHDDSDESLIKCGSYTGNGNADGPEIDLGWEPQFVLIKSATTAKDWNMFDTMRGIPTGGADAILMANESAAESVSSNSVNSHINLLPNGFQLANNSSQTNDPSQDYIYMAIRRPNKPAEEFEPEELFAIDTSNSTGNAPPQWFSGFPVDMGLNVSMGEVEAYRYRQTRSRLAPGLLKTNTTDAEAGSNPDWFAHNDGWANNNTADIQNVAWMWRRAPGFFDVVAYTGNPPEVQTIQHNLGVAPEMIWIKNRDTSNSWPVYYPTDNNQGYIYLNTSATSDDYITAWGNNPPNETEFTVSTAIGANANGADHIAYLFASVPGISKVGTYVGTGSPQTIDCGFSTGARFVLIKQIDGGGGDWRFFDTERGIVSGNDPMLALNSNLQQTAYNDYLTPDDSGFALSGNPANAPGDTFLFYAIA